MEQSRTKARFRKGCFLFLFLFGLPFAAIGVLATWWSWRSMGEADEMRSWVEAPAIITHTELKVIPARHRGGARHAGDSGPTFQAIARYEYEFGGRRFTGDRVSLDGSSDNIGSFQRNAYRELQRHFIQKKPFRCFVNPQRPSEAVLYRQLRWEMAAFYTLFATVFGAVGFGLLTGVLVSAWRRPRIRAAEAVAESPWLARTDWAAGLIRSSGGTDLAVPVLAVLVVWWAIASLPLMRKLPAIFESANSAWAVITLIFPAVGTVLLLAFVYQIIRTIKFGRSVLELQSIPGVVGGQLAGAIRIPRMVRPAEGFQLELSCIEGGIDDEPLWRKKRRVTEPMRDRTGGAIAVPVLFAIPYDAKETSRPNQDHRIDWRLDVLAEMPGVDYKARFGVPVFKTPDSRPDFKLDERLAAESATVPRREALLSEARILKEPLPGSGVRIVFTAGRNYDAALSFTVITLLWSGAIWLMLRAGTWVVTPILFGLFDVLLIWITAGLWFYRSVVEARPDGLMLQGGLFGIGRKHFIRADEVKEITISNAMSVNNIAWNNIAAVLVDETEWTIARSIERQLSLRAVIDELQEALGRRQEKRTRRSKIEETP